MTDLRALEELRAWLADLLDPLEGKDDHEGAILDLFDEVLFALIIQRCQVHNADRFNGPDTDPDFPTCWKRWFDVHDRPGPCVFVSVVVLKVDGEAA